MFEVRNRLVAEYGDYVRSFISIRDDHVRQRVEQALDEGLLWPEPRLALNPSFEEGKSIDELVVEGILHPEAAKVFRIKAEGEPDRHLRLHRHQEEAIRTARTGPSFVLKVPFKDIARRAPFVGVANRGEFRRRLSLATGVGIPDAKLALYPNFPLTVLCEPAGYEGVRSALELLMQQVKG